MFVRIAMWGTLVVSALAVCACGDDDDGGGGGGAAACERAEMLCENDNTVSFDCELFGAAPQSTRDCVESAADCDAVTACVFGAASEGAAGSAAD